MLNNNRVLLASLVALVLVVVAALVWVRARHSGQAASSGAVSAAPSAAAVLAPPPSGEAGPPPPPAPPAGEASVQQQQAAAANVLPTRVGQCAATTVKEVSTRLQDMPGSGSAVSFTNGGYQVSYDQVAEVDASQPGDSVRMCLVALPQDCPPGDNRGIEYRTTNQRTGQSWTLPDAEHACGGA